MVEEIQKYLQGENPDFNQGFALYCKYSHNESLISWIGRKRDMKKLIYELTKMNSWPGDLHLNAKYMDMAVRYNKSALPMPAKVEEKVPNFKTFDERRTKRGDLPENLQKVYDVISDDYKVRRSYHEKMKLALTDTDRKAAREQIIAANDRIAKNWEIIDAYLLKKTADKTAEDFKESTCRSYVTKMLKKDQLSPEQIEKLRIRVDALVAHGCKFNEQLTERLKALELI